ncbi:Polysaccharide pyruvyl transferase family protein WcaK [Agreia bicolorata]|uniref:Polysaccharide pyruvyl transferase family protein WcaK n=1 Tax=Agreia bicolorata TaxID=110935 RepID=A0A1T4XYG4_9MICO|nr:polysaccharide pyruvyl transferase family protein [Agreia bicolorata]SKA94597.1 Polysaccharide pyruvyl transferase family protein WcaK [Agreia bicolorata]
MTTTPRRIVFLGTHGQYNIGDELLLETFLTQLGAQHHYVVNSYDPEYTRTQLKGRFTVDVIDTARDRLKLLRELLHCDLLVFGGGSIVKELYASTGRNRYSTLLMILAIVTFAHRIARKPIAMLNIGVGPLRTPRGLRLARMILSQVDELTVRDERSASTCLSVGVEPVLATDAVFSLDRVALLGAGDRTPGEPAPPVHSAAAATRPVRIALNLNFDIENPSNWERFLTDLARVLEQVHADHPIELHSLPMQIGFKEHDDAEVLNAFAARIPSIPFVRSPLASHVDAAETIARCDIIVSERLHAIVMASILGVPAFVLAYDVKVKELATMLKLEPWTVDINEPFAVDKVAASLNDLIERRAIVSAQLGSRSIELHAEAQMNFAAVRDWIAMSA